MSWWGGRGEPGNLSDNSIVASLGRSVAVKRLALESERDAVAESGAGAEPEAHRATAHEKKWDQKLPDLVASVTHSINLRLDLEEAVNRMDASAEARRCKEQHKHRSPMFPATNVPRVLRPVSRAADSDRRGKARKGLCNSHQPAGTMIVRANTPGGSNRPARGGEKLAARLAFPTPAGKRAHTATLVFFDDNISNQFSSESQEINIE